MDSTPIDEDALEAKSTESNFESNGRNSKKKEVLQSSYTRDEPSAESKVKRGQHFHDNADSNRKFRKKSSRQSPQKKEKYAGK